MELFQLIAMATETTAETTVQQVEQLAAGDYINIWSIAVPALVSIVFSIISVLVMNANTKRTIRAELNKQKNAVSLEYLKEYPEATLVFCERLFSDVLPQILSDKKFFAKNSNGCKVLENVLPTAAFEVKVSNFHEAILSYGSQEAIRLVNPVMSIFRKRRITSHSLSCLVLLFCQIKYDTTGEMINPLYVYLNLMRKNDDVSEGFLLSAEPVEILVKVHFVDFLTANNETVAKYQLEKWMLIREKNKFEQNYSVNKRMRKINILGFVTSALALIFATGVALGPLRGESELSVAFQYVFLCAVLTVGAIYVTLSLRQLYRLLFQTKKRR